MNYKKIFSLIDKYNIVSFDIFDTLLIRMTPNPNNIFEIVESIFSECFEYKPFCRDRIIAEENARKKTFKEEITLTDIYDAFTNYSNEELEWLLRKEVEVEREMLLLNPSVIPIYSYCLEKRKKIIIQSDMYLSSDIIKDILRVNNIRYDYLAVSSELNMTKKSGTMYRDTVEKINCLPKEILHFGDSLKSDILMARKNGINSVRIKKYYEPNFHKNDMSAEEYDFLLNLKVNKPDSFYEKMGFQIMGPFYFGYSMWLNSEIKKEGIKKVFFLSRDGYIMQKAFRMIKDEDIEDDYLYVSRNSLIIPALFYCSEFDQVIELTNISVLKSINVSLFLKKIGLDPDDCKDELDRVGLSESDNICGSEIVNNTKIYTLFKLVKDKMLYHSKQQLEELKGYLIKKEFRGEVAIVDIGWQGTMQKALNIIVKACNIDVDITGYYIGIKRNALDFYHGKMHGYCFEPTNSKLENTFFSFGGLIEYFYSNNEGSVKEYQRNAPVLEINEYANTEYLEIMSLIQKGGLKYVSEAVKYYRFYAPISFYEYSLKKLFEFATKPKLQQLQPFKKIYYSNIYNYYMLPQHGFFYYLLHLKQLKTDINQSFWKIGFLKQLLKIPLPYLKIYEYLKGK